MRELVLDTETTGLDPLNGDRIVEIGCVEIFNHIATGQTYHQYINPERACRPVRLLFMALARNSIRLSGFCGCGRWFSGFHRRRPACNSQCEIRHGVHQRRTPAPGTPALPMSQSIDTVTMARRRFPGAPASLDALCRRLDIDNSSRTSMVRCLMPNCWPRCIWNCVAAVSPASALQPQRRKRIPRATGRNRLTLSPKRRCAPPDNMRRRLRKSPPTRRLSRRSINLSGREAKKREA